MTTLRVLIARCLGLFRKRRADADLSEEIDTHLEALANEHARNGASPEAARAAARREFGGVELVKDTYRSQRSLPLADALGRDVLYALRQLRANRTFTIVSVGSLALGIAATTVGMSSNAVISSTGTSGARSRSNASNSSPSIPGIRTSERTTSGARSARSATARAPSSAARTS